MNNSIMVISSEEAFLMGGILRDAYPSGFEDFRRPRKMLVNGLLVLDLLSDKTLFYFNWKDWNKDKNKVYKPKTTL